MSNNSVLKRRGFFEWCYGHSALLGFLRLKTSENIRQQFAHDFWFDAFITKIVVILHRYAIFFVSYGKYTVDIYLTESSEMLACWLFRTPVISVISNYTTISHCVFLSKLKFIQLPTASY